MEAEKQLEIKTSIQRERWKITLSILEDMNSIQFAVTQVMLPVTGRIDYPHRNVHAACTADGDHQSERRRVG